MQQDQLDIRELIDNWVLWRDSGDWDRFATVWHPDGCMHASWFRATATDFIARSRAAWEDGLTVLHTLGGSCIDVEGDRAVAETRMQIVQRGYCHGVLVDVSCIGRFWDVFEKRDGRWGMVLRQPIYELDRMQPVQPGASVALEEELLSSFPEGYRHLAYLQTGMGFKVSSDLPGTRGAAIEHLRHCGARWLAGEDKHCLDY